jgi:phage-related protein
MKTLRTENQIPFCSMLKSTGWTGRKFAGPAEGSTSDKARPFKGAEGGVFEIALRHRGDAFRLIYAVKIGADIWLIHAFQKKSKAGIKTPQMEVDLTRESLKRLNEALQ